MFLFSSFVQDRFTIFNSLLFFYFNEISSQEASKRIKNKHEEIL